MRGFLFYNTLCFFNRKERKVFFTVCLPVVFIKFAKLCAKLLRALRKSLRSLRLNTSYSIKFILKIIIIVYLKPRSDGRDILLRYPETSIQTQNLHRKRYNGKPSPEENALIMHANNSFYYLYPNFYIFV